MAAGILTVGGRLRLAYTLGADPRTSARRSSANTLGPQRVQRPEPVRPIMASRAQDTAQTDPRHRLETCGPIRFGGPGAHGANIPKNPGITNVHCASGHRPALTYANLQTTGQLLRHAELHGLAPAGTYARVPQRGRNSLEALASPGRNGRPRPALLQPDSAPHAQPDSRALNRRRSRTGSASDHYLDNQGGT